MIDTNVLLRREDSCCIEKTGDDSDKIIIFATNLQSMKANEVRQQFLDFFKSKQHNIVSSSPMVVKNDPTLMFTNAGMNQFKDIFLGNEPAKYKRVADTQKCLRVSGKHNDLEEVGHDTYHHTMFEMLGNWSFGDYFKKDAIDWAWELLVDVFKLPKDRIYATVFEGASEDGVEFDQEAYDCWSKYLPKDHILMGNKKDNFWEMGETGPCGPCSEVHFDLRDQSERDKVNGAELVNKSDPQVIEIWNLVFMQFNRKVGGILEPLPAKHVDTGMGFERLCMILQGKKSNYDTDVFTPTIEKISEFSGKKYGADNQIDIAMRVIADHLRAITFSIADGQMPSNVKAGYVIRRILRRAVRYAYTYLDVREPFISKLVPTLVNQMGGQFPELVNGQKLIEKIIFEEENAFLKTLATGINLLDNILAKSNGKISGTDAFTLYDTYGFPIDLTELIAGENGAEVDLVGFEAELSKQKERSRGAAVVETDDWVEIMPIEKSVFVGYDNTSCDVKIARYRKVVAKNKTIFQLVFDQTPFYGNSGGQVGEVGLIQSANEKIEIVNTLKENNLTIHIVEQLPSDLSADFEALVDVEKRNESAANHTATHLMHAALREVLGDHVEQKGSLVTPEYLRFDFSHFQKVTSEELRAVEKIVNAQIRANSTFVENRECPIEDAKNLGAMMLFGEKYGDTVRVVRFGDSVEFCGGMHATATGTLGFFRILSEGSSSAGIRRIEAVSGRRAEEHSYASDDILADLAKRLGSNKFVQALEKKETENADLAKQMDEIRNNRDKLIIPDLIQRAERIGAYSVIKCKMDIVPESVRNIVFAIKAQEDVAVVFGSSYGEKPMLTVGLSESLVALGLNAGAIVREAAKHIEGGGGGQHNYATAGGKKPSGMDDAIKAAIEIITEKLK